MPVVTQVRVPGPGMLVTMLAIVAPGQGAQSPGMLAPWLEIPGVADILAAFSAASGLDLVAHGTVSDADTIRDTAIAQPLIVATSLMALRTILDSRPVTEVTGVVAGHSVGEFAAAAAAGVFDDDDAVRHVTARAQAMAASAAANPSAMAAVLGGAADEVEAVIAAAGAWPANVNGGGQIVAAGTHAAIAALAADPPAKARVVPLQVAGAFHTPLMASAHVALGEAAASWEVRDAQTPFVSNRDGVVVTSGDEILARLVDQITSPVRWDLCQVRFADLGVTGVLELAPGGVLAGLARRTLPGVARLAVKGPDDIAPAREFIAEHAA